MSEDTAKMSLAEYFAYRGIKEAEKIEVTYADGTKVALDGHVAMMWWRTTHFLWKEDPTDGRRKDVYVFRAVDENGNLAPLTIPEMIEAHVFSTGICSFAHHMRTVSPTYKDIIALGDAALPAILEHLRDKDGGMNVILLLEDITKDKSYMVGHSPYTPSMTAVPGFAAYKVTDCRTAWIEWGKRYKYIK
jgi:hypothetical protein